MNEYEESYNLDEMDDADKNELILRLSDDLSTTNIVAIGLHNAMISLSTGLLHGDVLGSRARTMRSIALRMALVAAASKITLQTDWAQASEDAVFDDIVSRLEGDQ